MAPAAARVWGGGGGGLPSGGVRGMDRGPGTWGLRPMRQPASPAAADCPTDVLEEGEGVWDPQVQTFVHNFLLYISVFLTLRSGSRGAHAGHKALYTCTSWYAYAAMWRQFH